MPNVLSALLFDLYRGSRRVEPEFFQSWAFALVRKVLPFDSGSWVSGVLLEQGPVAHSCYLDNLTDEIMTDYLRIWNDDPLYRRMQAAMASTISLTTCDYDSAALRAHIDKYNIAYVLGTRTADSVTNLRTSICWFRSPDSPPFTEEHRQFKEALTPHLVETWAESRINYALKMFDTGHRPNHATAVADTKSVLHFADELFGELMTEEFPAWRGPYIPESLSSHLANDPTQTLVGRAIVVTAKKMGDHWLLRARFRAAYDTLGKREHEIARLVAGGQSRKEIAYNLGISQSTVSNHLATIYQKLGIGDKARLAQILGRFE